VLFCWFFIFVLTLIEQLRWFCLKKLILLGALSLIPSVVLAAPWDFLRPPMDAVMVVSPLIAWIVTIIALGVAIVSILAVRKKKSRRLMIVSGAFILFFIKSALALADLYVSPGTFMNVSVQGFFDLVIIGALFIALFRK